jgi:hypothetical protein
MYLVLGPMRTGTSRVMKTLVDSGIPLLGKQFPTGLDPKMNVHGFFQMDDDDYYDYEYSDKDKGKVHKTSFLFLDKIPSEIVIKAFVCFRNKTTHRDSCRKYMLSIGIKDMPEILFQTLLDNEYINIFSYLNKNSVNWMPCFFEQYDESEILKGIGA